MNIIKRALNNNFMSINVLDIIRHDVVGEKLNSTGLTNNIVVASPRDGDGGGPWGRRKRARGKREIILRPQS